jgi:phosphoglycerate dehydrogenase-like enzyme
MFRGKILVTDPVSPKLLELIEKEGFIHDYKPNITAEELMKIIDNYSCLIIRGRLNINRDILMASSNLKLIIRYGVGLDNIDLAYCRDQGIKVFNTPKAFTEPVAELTLALILGVLRGVGDGHYGIKTGRWIKKKLVGRELLDKTVGIIGFGRIGRD